MRAVPKIRDLADQEEDMPLSTEDVNRVADAVCDRIRTDTDLRERLARDVVGWPQSFGRDDQDVWSRIREIQSNVKPQ